MVMDTDHPSRVWYSRKPLSDPFFIKGVLSHFYEVDMKQASVVAVIVIVLVMLFVISTISFFPGVFDLFANTVIFLMLIGGVWKLLDNKPSIEKRTKEIIEELNKKGKSE